MKLLKPLPSKKIAQCFAIAGLVLSMSAAQAVTPPVQCFDFSNLVVGTEYFVGDVINIPDATVEFLEFYGANGDPSTSAVQKGSISSSGLAGSSAPEIRKTLINLRITPDQPLSRITMDYAQNTGVNNFALLSNLEINGEKIQLLNGMASADGVVLGNNAVGQVLIRSTMVNPVIPNPPQWINGELEFAALNGGIESVTVGGIQAGMDNVCLVP